MTNSEGCVKGINNSKQLGRESGCGTFQVDLTVRPGIVFMRLSFLLFLLFLILLFVVLCIFPSSFGIVIDYRAQPSSIFDNLFRQHQLREGEYRSIKSKSVFTSQPSAMHITRISLQLLPPI